MANPSLQIGNSNWAIKEDNLLGYSTAGTRFLPQPITMTRASAGTRVNPQGLIETVELLGSEVVTNGDLTGGSTGWTLEAGWTYGTNALDFDSITNIKGAIPTITALVVGKIYKLTFDLSNISLTSKILFSNIASNLEYVNTNSNYVNGSYEFYFNATDTDFAIYGYSVGDSFSIDNVSVKEVTRNNLARVDYDGTASSLLVEPQRTNLATYSQNFTNGNFWDFQGASQIDNSIISPDGTQNADKFYPSSTGNFKGLAKSFGSTLNAAAYTLSAFVKKGGKDFFFFYNLGSPQGSGGVWFNINTGVIGNVGNAYSNVKIENVGNGWFRCSATLNYGGTNDYSYLLMSDSNGSLTATVNGTDGIYLWGTQIEEGSYPTSYIPTSGSSVTRIADQYTKTGISNLINSTEGVVYMDFIAQNTTGLSQSHFWLGSSGNEIGLYGGSQFIFYSSGGVQINGGNIVTNQRYKVAFGYKANDYVAYVNGTQVGTDTSATVPTMSGLAIGSYFNGVEIQKKNISDFKLYKTRLSNSELATLTTI